MKNKKGFTLIELMAVIIILAVIALIVTPLILNSMKDSKEKLYQTQLENIKSAARSYMVNIELEENKTINLSVGELKRSGFLKSDIENPKTNEGFKDCVLVNVQRKSESYIYTVDEDSINNCDGSSIDINGNITMLLLGYINDEIEINKNYIDDGIILRDRNNNNIDLSNVKVVVTQTIDGNSKVVSDDLSNFNNLTTLIDTTNYYKYEIKYSYTDLTTSETKELTRTVNVKDVNDLVNLIKPIVELNTIDWSKSKIAKVTFAGEGNYLVKASKDVTTNVAADSCLIVNNEQFDCANGNHIQANGIMLANVWYKVSSNKLNLTFNNNALLELTVSNGTSYKSSDPLNVEKIDNTAPEISNFSSADITSTQNGNKLTFTVTAKDKDDEGSSGSGVVSYTFSVDNPNYYQAYNTNELGSSDNGVFTTNKFNFVNSTDNEYAVTVCDKVGNCSEKTLKESCSISNPGTCYNGSKTTVYTCTGTNRTYSVTSTSGCPTTTTPTTGGGSSCPGITCPSGLSVCGCSCCQSGSSDDIKDYYIGKIGPDGYTTCCSTVIHKNSSGTVISTSMSGSCC